MTTPGQSETCSPRGFVQYFPLVYEELHGMARRALRLERPDHTLQPTALVNELFLRLEKQRKLSLQDRARFLAAAATMMRRILVDYSKSRNRKKREGLLHRISIQDHLAVTAGIDIDLIMLHEALEDLERLDPRKGRLVELRFFSGLTMAEAAEVLGLSERTVANDWVFARAWLHRELREEHHG